MNSTLPKLSGGRNKPLIVKIDQMIKSYVMGTLITHEFRLGETAKALGISRTSLWRIMKKFEIVKKKKSDLIEKVEASEQ